MDREQKIIWILKLYGSIGFWMANESQSNSQGINMGWFVFRVAKIHSFLQTKTIPFNLFYHSSELVELVKEKLKTTSKHPRGEFQYWVSNTKFSISNNKKMFRAMEFYLMAKTLAATTLENQGQKEPKTIVDWEGWKPILHLRVEWCLVLKSLSGNLTSKSALRRLLALQTQLTSMTLWLSSKIIPSRSYLKVLEWRHPLN